MHSITDLGWPVSLIDVALGVLASKRSRTPVYISGYDPGYEEVAFPGLYDPATAGDVSPLMNAFETAALVDSPCPMVDAFKLEMAPDSVSPKLLAALDSRLRADPGCGRGAGRARRAQLVAARRHPRRRAEDRARPLGQADLPARGGDDAGAPPDHRGHQEPRQPCDHGSRGGHRRLERGAARAAAIAAAMPSSTQPRPNQNRSSLVSGASGSKFASMIIVRFG